MACSCSCASVNGGARHVPGARSRHERRRARRGWPAASAHRGAALGDDALPSHQAAVIAHEQSHLEARDPQLFTLALALLVFMPWNLPLWWQLRRLRYAIEIDCDARVLKGGVDPATTARR